MARLPRVYIDLDETLVAWAWPDDRDDTPVVGFLIRPGVDGFLRAVGRIAEPWLLTTSERSYAEAALSLIDPSQRAFAGLITREDLSPVEDAVDGVMGRTDISRFEKEDIVRSLPPIAKPGLIVDNMPPGSDAFWVKTVAAGVGPESWIHVPPFERGSPDSGGLGAALAEIERRLGP